MRGTPSAAIGLKALPLSFTLPLNVGVFPNVLFKGISVVPEVSWVLVVTWVKMIPLIVFQFGEALPAASGIFPSSILWVEARGSYVLIVSPFSCKFMVRWSAIVSAE